MKSNSSLTEVLPPKLQFDINPNVSSSTQHFEPATEILKSFYRENSHKLNLMHEYFTRQTMMLVRDADIEAYMLVNRIKFSERNVSEYLKHFTTSRVVDLDAMSKLHSHLDTIDQY